MEFFVITDISNGEIFTIFALVMFLTSFVLENLFIKNP